MSVNLEGITIEQFNEFTKQYRDFRNYIQNKDIIDELAEVEEVIDYDEYNRKMEVYSDLSEAFIETLVEIESRYTEEMSYFESEQKSESFWCDFYDKIGQLIDIYNNYSEYNGIDINEIKNALTINGVNSSSGWGDEEEVKMWISFIKLLWGRANELLKLAFKHDSNYEIPFSMYHSLSSLYRLNKDLKDLI